MQRGHQRVRARDVQLRGELDVRQHARRLRVHLLGRLCRRAPVLRPSLLCVTQLCEVHFCWQARRCPCAYARKPVLLQDRFIHKLCLEHPDGVPPAGHVCSTQTPDSCVCVECM